MENKLTKRCLTIFAIVLSPIILAIILRHYGGDVFNHNIKFVVIIFSIFISFLSVIMYFIKPNKIYKILIIVNFVGVIFISLYTFLYYKNLIYVFSSVQEFKKFILDTGSAGVIVYILIQMLQVIILPIPGAVICVTGALVYGPVFGSLYCSVGVILGSIVSFWLGRIFGYKLVVWVSGKENAMKYSVVLDRKGKTFLPLAFLLPLFPDDILCLIAGITNMKFKYFFWVVVIFRPISVIGMSFFGGGYIVPFSGWGLYLWGIIVVLMVFVVYITTKYQDNIETWVINRFSKK